MYLRYDNLEKSTWTPVSGPSISSIPATAAAAIPEADGLRLYEIGPSYAGILWKMPCLVPLLATKGTATLSMLVMTDDAGAVMSQAQEFDLMIVGQKGEVYNGSEQLNNAEGGNWQNITAAYKWADIGFNPGKLQPNTWVPIAFTVKWDTPAGVCSIVSVTVGGTTFEVPSPVAVPVQQLAWAPNQIVVQIQLDESVLPGGYSEKVKAVTLEVQWMP